MPIFEYECQICNHRTTANRSIAERNNGPDCCNGKMEKRIFTPTMAEFPEWNVDYFCKGLGKPITSMRQRTYELESRGLMDAREFGEPDPDAMQAKADAVQNYKPTSTPGDLKDAMVREGHGDLL